MLQTELALLVSPPCGKSVNPTTVHSWCMKGPRENHAKLICCACVFLTVHMS